MRNTSVPLEVRHLVIARARGRCERCGDSCYDVAASVHHRRRRGMGGSRLPWIGTAPNLLLLCGTGTTGCHNHVETNRLEAYDVGWLLRAGVHPATAPVLIHDQGLVLLTDDGRYEPC